MFETLDRVVLASLGALSMSRERAEKIFDEAVQRGQEVRGTREHYVDELMDSAEKARKNLENMMAQQVQKVLTTLNLPTREELARIEAKIDLLLARPCEQ